MKAQLRDRDMVQLLKLLITYLRAGILIMKYGEGTA